MPEKKLDFSTILISLNDEDGRNEETEPEFTRVFEEIVDMLKEYDSDINQDKENEHLRLRTREWWDNIKIDDLYKIIFHKQDYYFKIVGVEKASDFLFYYKSIRASLGMSSLKNEDFNKFSMSLCNKTLDYRLSIEKLGKLQLHVETEKKFEWLTQHNKFLRHVGYGEQEEAETMLQKDKNLALICGDLTDCSLRTWKHITAFQYAILALDYHMWTMMQKHINTEDAHQQIAELINKATLKDKEGWIIKPGYNEWPKTGWSPLIEALDLYVKNYEPWSAEQCKTHWYQKVGGAQLILPAHVINEYSHPFRSFYPCPKWNGYSEPLLPRTGVTDWINYSGNRLGSNFAWVRSDWINSGRNKGGGRRMDCIYDLTACIELMKSRIEQAQALLVKLISSPGNAPRVVATLSDPKETFYQEEFTQAQICEIENYAQKIYQSVSNNFDDKCVTTRLSHESSSSSFTASFISSAATNQTMLFSASATPQDSSILTIISSPKTLDKFLKHICFGEQDEAEEMLKKDNYLALEAGDLIDCAKREFKQITAFQYSIWALDFHMWQMLLKYLPQEEASKQVIDLGSGGWVQIHGHHADWQNLIDALQTYIDHYNLWSHEQLSDYWCQQVGGTQLLLPAHVINEYNHPLRSFHLAPSNLDYDFILPRTGIDRWFTQGNRQLGKDFAWGRGGCDQAVAGLIGGDRWGARFGLLRDELPDLDAMRTILAYRTEQVRMLIFLYTPSLKPQASSLKPQASSLT